MANIKKIKTPNGTTYDIVDADFAATNFKGMRRAVAGITSSTLQISCGTADGKAGVYLIVSAAGADTHCGMWLIRKNSTNSLFVSPIKPASAISYATTGVSITFSMSSSRNTQFLMFKLFEES